MAPELAQRTVLVRPPEDTDQSIPVDHTDGRIELTDPTTTQDEDVRVTDPGTTGKEVCR